MELEEWEAKLANEEHPNLGDIHALAKTSKKIYAVLKKNGLIEAEQTGLIAKS